MQFPDGRWKLLGSDPEVWWRGWWLGRGPRHASAYGCCSKNFLSFALALFALGIWCIISFVLVSGSLCSGRLGVAYEYENWIFREITVFVGAILGSTVATCSASVLWWVWTNCTHFPRCGGLES